MDPKNQRTQENDYSILWGPDEDYGDLEDDYESYEDCDCEDCQVENDFCNEGDDEDYEDHDYDEDLDNSDRDW